MDVTPQELRSAEFKESFRGYAREDVTEALEKCAATIEHLTAQVEELQGGHDGDSPLPNRSDSDVIARTLVLAQKAADDAVTEARARAEEMLIEADTRAQATVNEAEMNARRLAEAERRRHEEELRGLEAQRDRLTTDVDALEAFVDGYRDRVRSAIEADLASLSGSLIVEPPTAKPDLRGVEDDTPAPAATAPAIVSTVAPSTPPAEPAPDADVTDVRSVVRDPEWVPVSGG
jgi:DivIVA domain-containing protein